MDSRKRILLVEDDRELSAIIQEELSDFNIEIITVYFVNEAIDLLKNGLEVDFIVSDYSMPLGNGIELLEYLTINKYSVPFIFFTHNINPEITNYTYFLGVISKFEMKKLKTIIKKSILL